MMKFIAKMKKFTHRAFLHLVLVAGSILFAAPFIWLGSTSAKVPDEMYPPKWVPQIPTRVMQSPYLQLRENERVTRPFSVSEENWSRLSGPIQAAISKKMVSMASELPDFYGPNLSHPTLAEGAFSRLLKRAPDEIFDKSEQEAAEWFTQRLDGKLVREIFEVAYRCVALSDVTISGRDVTVEYPTQTDEKFPWRVSSGDATITTRPEGYRRPAQEVEYSFEKNHSFALSSVMPIHMKPENLKKITVSNHGDRSWHKLGVIIELAGRKWESAQPAFSGTDRWQETTWQTPSEDDNAITMKTYLRLKDAGPSDFNEAGKIKLTLNYSQANGLWAAFNKYINNYRNALRMAPFWLYAKNSLLLVALNILGQIVGSSLVAFSFARLRWPARDFCFTLLLATLMIPAQVTMIPVFLIYKNLGWYDTLRPLWVASFFGSAFYIFLLRQFMRGIPADLEDSAKIDGCGYLGIYAQVILPLIKPALAAIGILTFMSVWNDFMGPLIYLNDQRLYPLSLGLFSLQVFQQANCDYGLMMAAAVLTTLPVIFLFFAAQRHFIQGVTLTGLKG
jgi:ABC-type glycerol-3-phosphate transport system permease component